MAHRVSEEPNGVEVFQITDEPGVKDNLYCERSYCAPDSSFFVWRRQLPGDTGIPQKWFSEFVACEFGTWRERVLFPALSYPLITRNGAFYLERLADDGSRELFRFDLATEETRRVPVEGGVRPWTGMTASPDERFLAYGVPLGFEPQMFGVELVDLTTGAKRVLCSDPHICNPHTYIAPIEGKWMLVQHNRGCRFAPDGTQLRLLGPEGCTFFLLSVPGGERRPLPVGPPHTPSMSGHSQWVDAETLLMTTYAPWETEAGVGTLVRLRLGEPPELLTPGPRLNHIHVSLCGRYWIGDDIATGEVFVGSVATGARALLCHVGHDHATIHPRFSESGHAHAYLSPDLKWAVFNSCRTGRPEVHVASVPPALLASLD